MVHVSHISKSFGAHPAVRDVSFDLAEGEVTVLLGPNGAGKTTTMRVIAGYYVPDSGEVTIGDISLATDPVGARRKVGYLPESNPLYKDMLVCDYLTFAARTMQLNTAQLRPAFDRVVDQTGIDEVFYRPISELSKGFRQRVGLAGALIADPDVLILDEPTEGLDPNQRSDMRTLLTTLARDKTVLVSTHVLGEAQQIASRVIVLNRGALVGMGRVEDLLGNDLPTVYHLDIEGTKPEVAVRKLSSVEAVSVSPTGESSHTQLVVTVHAPERFPKELSNMIGAEHLVLWRLAPDQSSLERAFTELTRTPNVSDTPHTVTQVEVLESVPEATPALVEQEHDDPEPEATKQPASTDGRPKKHGRRHK